MDTVEVVIHTEFNVSVSVDGTGTQSLVSWDYLDGVSKLLDFL